MRRLIHAPHPAVWPSVLFAVLAALVVRIVPTPHAPLHYVIAGTVATSGALIAVFLRLVVPRPEPSHPEPPDRPDDDEPAHYENGRQCRRVSDPSVEEISYGE